MSHCLGLGSEDVARPVKEVRDTADDIVLARNRWSFKSDDIKEILSRLLSLDGIVANLAGRLALIEDGGLSRSENSFLNPAKILNLLTFFLIIASAVGISYSNQALGFPSLRIFFFVTLMIAFLSLAPGKSMDHIIPSDLSKSTIFWGCLIAGCIIGSVDKQLEEDLIRLFPVLGGN